MKRFSFKQNKTAHFAAMTIAVLLHLMIFLWLNKKTQPTVLQQSIHVTMVAPTSKVKKKPVTKQEPKKEIITSRSKDKKPKIAKEEPVKEEKEEPKKQEKQDQELELETSGKIDQKATAQESAQVDPVFNAAYLNNTPPIYPSSARRKGVEGRVMLEVLVTREGKAKNVQIAQSSGYSILDRSAIKAVKQWSFVPAYKGLVAVEASVLVPIEFKLKE